MRNCPGNQKTNFLETGSVLVSIATLFFLLFPGVLLRGEIIAPLDLAYQYSPWRNENPVHLGGGFGALSDQWDQVLPSLVYQYDRMLAGEVPSYTDKVQNGTPLFWVINHEAKVIPLLVLRMLFDFPIAWTLFLFVKVLMGGCFLYLYLRILGLQHFSGLFAAVAFSFSSYAMQNLGITMTSQYALIPVALFGTERIIRARSLLWIFLWPWICSQVIMAGYPVISAYILTFLAAYIVFRALRDGDTAGTLLIFAALFICAVAFSAPALLASSDFFAHFDWSYRAQHWSHRIPLYRIKGFLTPFSFERVDADWLREVVYIGVAPLILVVGVVRVKGTSAWRLFFLGTLLLVLAFIYDIGGVLRLYRHIPIFNSSMPNNLIVLVPLLASILAGMGLEDVSFGRVSVCRILIITGGAVALLLILQGESDLPSAISDVSSKERLMLQYKLLALSFFVFLSLRLVRWKRLAKIFCLLLLGLDLYAFSKGLNTTVPVQAFYAETRGIRFLKRKLEDGKLFLLDSQFPANSPQAFGLRTVAGRGFFTHEMKRLYQGLRSDVFEDLPTLTVFLPDAGTRLDSPIFDALSIKYVAAPRLIDLGKPLPSSLILFQEASNANLALKAGDSLTQEFSARSDAEAGSLALFISNNSLAAKTRLHVEVTDQSDSMWTFTKDLIPDSMGLVEVNTPPLHFRKGKLYRLRIDLDAAAKGIIEIPWMEGLGSVSPGRLSLNGSFLDGKLMVALFGQRATESSDSGHFRMVYDRDLTIWENTRAFQRAWLAGRVVVMEDDKLSAELAKSKPLLDFRNNIYVASLVSYSDANALEPQGSVEGSVRSSVLTDTHQVYEVDAQRSGFLVISDNYDSGWKVAINGLEGQMLRANLNMRAVRVPAGRSTVVLDYAPRFLTLGISISIIAAFIHSGALVIALIGCLDHKKAGHRTRFARLDFEDSTSNSTSSPPSAIRRE